MAIMEKIKYPVSIEANGPSPFLWRHFSTELVICHLLLIKILFRPNGDIIIDFFLCIDFFV